MVAVGLSDRWVGTGCGGGGVREEGWGAQNHNYKSMPMSQPCS